MSPRLHKACTPLLIVLFFYVAPVAAQLKPAEALKRLYDDYPQEKIYTWLNKPAFIAGETIWFKVYAFSGYDLSKISSNIYVELLGNEKRSISVQRYPLMKGVAYGNIELDSSLHEDVYYLRIYTDWMLNFDEQFQYLKPIPVYNPASKFKLEQITDQWEVGVYPEGGSLIEGIENQVAVRLRSAGPLPSNWTGYVTNDSGIKVTTLDVLDPNVALFTITPSADSKYKVVVSDGNGITKIAVISGITKGGAILNTAYLADTLSVTIRFRNVAGEGNGYTLVGHIQNQLVYEALIKSSSSTIIQKINTKDYLNGILHLTLFDPDKKPVAERLVFMNPSKLLFENKNPLDLKFENSPRTRNELHLRIDSVNWNSYAIQVLDDDIPRLNNSESLLSSLWLSSDLTSTINDPASFFDSPNEKKIKALDAILITEKWKRFEWEKILAGKFPGIKYKPQNFLTYSGAIKTKKDISPNDGVSLLIGNPGSPSQIVLTTIDSSLNVSVDNILYMGNFFSYYRLNNGRKYAGKKIDIEFSRIDAYESYHSPLAPTGFKLVLEEPTNAQPDWVRHNYQTLQFNKANDARFKTLSEVVIRSNLKTKKEQLHDKLATGRFRISDENIFDFVNEKQDGLALPSIFHWLQRKINGLEAIYDMQEQMWVPAYRRFTQSRLTPKIVKLYLNEGETTASWLNHIPFDNIIMIKVITAPRSLAFGNDVGLVISVYNERDSIIPAYREGEFRNKMLKGYDKPLVYAMPQYDNPALVFPEKDARSELLWQPVIAPEDSTFKSGIRFFNNDSVKNLRIIIQGFNNEGFPVYINKVIKSDATKPF